MWTEIWCKKEFSEIRIPTLVRIVYNPCERSAKEVMQDWVLPEFWYQCYAFNTIGE